MLITSNASVMLGKQVFAGTRISVELILGKLAEGESHQSILESYPTLAEAHILEALHYAHQIIDSFKG
jgi:uncharacterized protein (DUF433 family)